MINLCHRMFQVASNSATPYLSVLVLSVLGAKLAQYVWQYIWPGFPMIAGQAPGIWVSIAGSLAAGVLWGFYRGAMTQNKVLRAFLAALAIGGVIQLAIAHLHGDATTYASLLFIPIACGLLLKTPSRQDALRTTVVFGWIILTSLVITRCLELFGLIPMVDVGSSLREFETAYYWLPLADVLGPAGRWPGPYGHNSDTGYAAAIIVIIGLGLKGFTRGIFVLVGVITLLITGSRSSQLAAALAACVIALTYVPKWRLSLRWNLAAAVSAAFGLLILVVAVFSQSPNLTGRWGFWELTLSEVGKSPWIGIGATGMADSEAAIIGMDAHNVALDALLKSGLIGLGFVLVILVLGLTLAVGAAKRGGFLPLAMFTLFLAVGLSESDVNWSQLSFPIMWLMLAALLSTIDAPSTTKPSGLP